MRVEIDLADDVLARFGNQLGALGARAPAALGRALNHTGNKARTQVIRALTKQTGLKRKVIVRALKITRPVYGGSAGAGASLAYSIRSRGGDISMKFFNARETRAGVSATPFGQRRIVSGSFQKGGRFPSRVTAAGLNGHVWKRVGAARRPLEKIKSGVVIPEQMVEGATKDAFETVVRRDLPARVAHEIGRLLPGA